MLTITVTNRIFFMVAVIWSILAMAILQEYFKCQELNVYLCKMVSKISTFLAEILHKTSLKIPKVCFTNKIREF